MQILIPESYIPKMDEAMNISLLQTLTALFKKEYCTSLGQDAPQGMLLTDGTCNDPRDFVRLFDPPFPRWRFAGLRTYSREFGG